MLYELNMEKMMKRIFAAALALGMVGVMSTAPASAQSQDPEVKICLETVAEMTGGKASAKAKKLCEEKKLNEAIEEAMKAG